MRKLTWFEKVVGGSLLASIIACAALAAWAMARFDGRPIVIRNESGQAVEIVPIGTTRDRLEVVKGRANHTPMIRIAAGWHTELAYDYQHTNLCWLVIFAKDGDARVFRTPLAQSHPDGCAVEAGSGRPCCNPLPRGLEIVIPPLRELEPAPPPILEAATSARKH